MAVETCIAKEVWNFEVPSDVPLWFLPWVNSMEIP